MNFQTEGIKKDILEALIDTAPIFQKLFPLDCSISITNREFFLADFPSKEVKLNFKEGMLIPENSGVKK
ncbi:MAG: hypothetical protein ACOX2A_03095 [Tepidanaerobacteraceae bacterium]|jgi:hypothetical protein|nr:hypothetical protein [Thermoanaerobacterales bacterium]